MTLAEVLSSILIMKKQRVFRSHRVSSTSSSLVLCPRTRSHSQCPKSLRLSILGLRSSMFLPRMRLFARIRRALVLRFTFSGRSMLLMSIRPRSTVDELDSAKKQALTAAFASMALYLFLDNFVYRFTLPV